MRKPNYQFEKRRRDLEKKAKNEEKRLRKLEKSANSGPTIIEAPSTEDAPIDQEGAVEPQSASPGSSL